jgi:RNA polymerase sigma-70 factor (ECF subfamily)
MPEPQPIPNPNDEQDLVRRCQSGDGAAWDQLFNLHYDAVGRFIFQIMPSFQREDAQEVCQETFLMVVRRLQTFSGRSRLQTWIFRIAANKARDYLDRQRAAKRGGGENPVSLNAPNPQTGLCPDLPSTRPGPDSSLLAQEDMLQLRDALDHLGGPCRDIIELRYFADLSYQDISEQLDLNLKTVSSRLSKCLDKLQAILQSLLHREKNPANSV